MSRQAMVVTCLTTEPLTRTLNSEGYREKGASRIHSESPTDMADTKGGLPTSSLRKWRPPTGLLWLLIFTAALTSCDLTPSKPEAVFILYRDRMKSDRVDEARKLLTQESRKLATDAVDRYKLKQYPENLALLNVLDPISIPVVMREEENSVLLQLRTMRGGLRLVRLTRENSKSPWLVDISAELKSFVDFLEVRSALNLMREQAGEYAASWKAFDNQLRRMQVVEPPPAPRTESSSRTSTERRGRDHRSRRTRPR